MVRYPIRQYLFRKKIWLDENRWILFYNRLTLGIANDQLPLDGRNAEFAKTIFNFLRGRDNYALDNVLFRFYSNENNTDVGTCQHFAILIFDQDIIAVWYAIPNLEIIG